MERAREFSYDPRMRIRRPLSPIALLLLAGAAPALADVVPPGDLTRRPKLQPRIAPIDPFAESTGTIKLSFRRQPDATNVVARQTTDKPGALLRSIFSLQGSTSDVRVTYDSPSNVEVFKFPGYAGVTLVVWRKDADADFWMNQAARCLDMAIAFQTATPSSTLDITVRPSKAAFQAFRQMRQANPNGVDVNLEAADTVELTCELHTVPAR